jgi:4-hydroxy-2-oxoheptanedioate aldolase
MDEYVKQANEETFLLVQIEEPAAVEQAQAIAEVEGVDGLFFGPADFSVLSGIAGQATHRLVNEARQKIANAAQKAGKHWGQPAGTLEQFEQFKDMGASFIPYGADLIMVRMGLEEIQEQLGQLGISFDNRMPNSPH